MVLLLRLKRGKQLLEFRLIRGVGLFRPRKLDEDVAAGCFDNCTEKTVAWNRVPGGQRSPETRVIAGCVNSRDRYSASRGALDDLGRRWLSIHTMELPFPPFDVRFHAAALASPKEVDPTLGVPILAGYCCDRVGGGTHRLWGIGLPAGRWRPIDAGSRFGERPGRAKTDAQNRQQ